MENVEKIVGGFSKAKQFLLKEKERWKIMIGRMGRQQLRGIQKEIKSRML